MANFNYLDFYKIPNTNDKKLFIKNNNNVVVWSIDVFKISSTILQNNNIRINFKNGDFVLIDFNNLYESKYALTKLQEAINTLNVKIPFEIDKDIKLYVDNLVYGTNSVNLIIGTAGYIPYYNTGLTISSSNLYWDNTNGRLGIGTASPTYSLDVIGSSRVGTLLIDKFPSQLGIGEGWGIRIARNKYTEGGITNSLTQNARGFQENSLLTMNSNSAYASFDALTLVYSDSVMNTDHIANFQARSVWEGGSFSSTLNDYYGFASFPSVKNGVITNVYDFISGGLFQTGASTSITNHYILYGEDIAKNANNIKVSNSWGLYLKGNSVSNYIQGDLILGTNSKSGYKLDVNGKIRFNNIGFSVSNATYSLIINPSTGQISYTASIEKDFISATIENSSTSSISEQIFVSKGNGYNRGISLTYSFITLNENNSSNKIYKITTDIYVYNAATESYIYRGYLNGTYSGMSINLGQNGILDFNYRNISITDIVVLTASATYSFWKFTSNTINPILVGNINITEL